MDTEYYYESYKGSVDIIHFDMFYRRARWRLVFLWWPRQCNLTGKKLWLCKAYEGRATWTGPALEPVEEKYWHSKKSHVWWILRR